MDAMKSATPPAAIDDFVSRHEEISSAWDQLHEDFDQWNAGLDACHPNAMHQALNGFAVSFNDVTQDAQNLSRGMTSAELADLLIVAAQEEEAALRQLRDRWQPGNVSLFENVEQARAKSTLAQKSAQDKAIELRDGFSDTADPEAVAEFQAALEPIQTDWAALHYDYETLQDDADTLGVAAVVEGLEAHVKGLEAITEALEELPELEGTEDTVEALQGAVEAETDAFEAAIKESAKSASSDAEAGESAESGDASESTESANGSDGGDGESADEPKLPDFEKLEASVAASADALKDAGRTIKDLADPDAGKGIGELDTFNTEYARVVNAWDDFHDDFSEWRGSGAGCDSGKVVQGLDDFSVRMGQLARDVRGLPSAGYLLPIYDLLTEAAARDENAVRSLRYTWQPFTIDAFKAVDRERIDTNDLRRQADIAVQELQNRS